MTPPEPSPIGAELSAHTAYLRGLARALLGPRGDVEDLVQDTLVAALEHPPRRAGGLRAWLATIARNRAVGLRRGDARRSARETDAARPESTPDASEAAERLELAQRLAAEVARLREPYRTAVYLRYHEGLAPSAIAARLGVPVKTVRTRLHRALEQLRARLDARAGGREAWGALLLPLAFPRGAPTAAATGQSVPLATPLIGGLVVKKLAVALVAVVVLGLAVQGVRALVASSGGAAPRPASLAATPGAQASAPDPADEGVEVAVESSKREPLQVADAASAPTTGELVVTLVWADDGAPAADACAEVEVLDGRVPRPDRLHVRTDAEGRARFDGLPEGRVRIHAPVGGSQVAAIVAGEVGEARLVLPMEAVVEGRVVAPDGGPVVGAEVRAQRWDGRAFLAHAIARSGPDGRFRARGVVADDWISAVAPGWSSSWGFRPGDMPVGAHGSREVELVLGAPGARLAGRVVDAEGEPVVGAQVIAGSRGGANQNLPSGKTAVSAAPALLFTGADGTFEVLGDLPPGVDSVEVVAAGHPVWFGQVELRSGNREWLEVRLPRPATLVGRVLDARGAPYPGALVRASREVGAHRDMDRTPVPTTYTDESGDFELDWVQSGEIEVRANAPKDAAAGRARVPVVCVEGERTEVELRLDPEPAIRGRLVDADRTPLAGWSVHARTSEWLEMSPFHSGVSSLVDLRRTDPDGRFEFQNAGEFAWDLSASAPDEVPFPPRATLAGVRAGAGEVEIVVENAATQPAVLLVRLVDADGRPPQDVQATLWNEHRDAGVFPEYDATTGVARWSVSLPGRYSVQVRRGSRSVHQGELVELRSGVTTDLGEVFLGVPGELVVEIDGPEAWGLEHVDVRVVPVGGIEELTLERDDLEFRAEGVAPGRYVLRAGHKALYAPEREIEVLPGALVREEVELVPAFPVRVTFEFPVGQEDWKSLDWEVHDATGARVRSDHMRNWSDFPGATAAPAIFGLGLPAGSYTLRAATDAGLRAELPLEFAGARAARGPHVLVFHP